MKEINVPFNAWSKARLRIGKTCTSRTKIYGEAGDFFVVEGKAFRISCVVKLPTDIIIKFLFKPEGAESPEELRRILNGIFRGKPLPEMLYTHFFYPYFLPQTHYQYYD